MELDRIEMAKDLWQMLRKILRDGELMKHDSELRKTAALFEDELYTHPKHTKEDLQTETQHIKAEIAKKLQWYKVQQCDGESEVDIPSVIDDLKQLAAVE